jgi:hypothetical protein
MPPTLPALDRAISLLQNSQDSLYAHLSVDEVITALQTIQTKFEQTGILDKTQLNLLFGPTGSIQEISIDNGWGYEFIKLAGEVDKITGNK